MRRAARSIMEPSGKARRALPAGMFDELVVDSFAGGGGASIGIERGLGRAVDVALNHCPDAIAMHRANHPHTLHLLEDVWKVDPHTATGDRPVRLLWASPDCKHFSRAKGAKPVEKRIRSLAWVVVKWARETRPAVIMLENVREFQEWGPLGPDSRPIAARKGDTFRRWVNQLRRLGYAVEWKVLNAADFGAPTHRRRLFIIARRDGQPIVWPPPEYGATNGKVQSSGVDQGGRSARASAPPGTEARGEGADRSADGAGEDGASRCGAAARGDRGWSPSGHRDRRPLRPYRTAAECIDWSLPCHSIFLTKEEGRALGVKRPLAEKTLRRIAAGIWRFVINDPSPFIVPLTHEGERRNHSINEPMPTVTGANRGEHALVTATLAPPAPAPGAAPCGGVQVAQEGGDRGEDPQAHGGHSSTGGAEALAPCISQYFGGMVGKRVDEPCPSITATDHNALVAATLIRNNHGEKPADRPEEPLRTVTTQGNKFGIAAATLIQTGYGEREGQAPRALDLNQPLGTVVAGGAKHAVAAAFLSQFRGTAIGQRADAPIGALTAQGTHWAQVSAFLVRYYGQGVGQGVAQPLHTVTTQDRFGPVTVTIHGVEYAIVDIGLRMLTPRELARAQGFPDSYRLTGSKTSQIARIGNSVCPAVAEALVRANFPPGSARPRHGREVAA